MPKMNSATGWGLVAEERVSFASMIEGLDDQADHATLCGHWTVHQVAGHLLTFTNLSFPRFFGNMVKNRLNYDAMADKIATRFAETKSLHEIAADLRTNAGKKSALPGFPPEMTLTDVTIHGQDIRRPLGLGVEVDQAVLRAVLDFMTTHKQAKAVFDPRILDDLKLVATDMDWSFGSGATVEGPGEALMMGLAGRPVADDLTGDGAAKL